MRAQMYVMQTVLWQNMLSAIVHKMRRSQDLPGYPHSSAGAYGGKVREESEGEELRVGR